MRRARRLVRRCADIGLELGRRTSVRDDDGTRRHELEATCGLSYRSPGLPRSRGASVGPNAAESEMAGGVTRAVGLPRGGAVAVTVRRCAQVRAALGHSSIVLGER